MTQWAPEQQQTQTAPPKRRRRWPWIALGVVAVSTCIGVGAALIGKPNPAPTTPALTGLDKAYQDCGSKGHRATLSGNLSVDLDTSSTAAGSSRAAAMGDITCVLTELGAPTTNPGARGTYAINWGAYSATWTNTAVGGVEVLIVERVGATASPAVTGIGQ